MANNIVLGTVQLGLEYGVNNKYGKLSLDTAFDILHIAYDNGIRTLDSAESYGNSQEIIGKFQKENPNKKFNIITKLSANNTLNKGELYRHIVNNCEVLGVNQLYGYMFHNYQNFISKVQFYDEILFAKKKGIIKKTGISLYTNTEMESVIANYNEFDFIQIPFNLFDNESKRKKIMKKAKTKGIEIYARSIFLQGLFFKNSNAITGNLKPLIPYLEELEFIKYKNGVNTEALALQYVLQKEYIDYVLIGVESTEQLLSNIKIYKYNYNIPHASIDRIHVEEYELLNPSNWK